MRLKIPRIGIDAAVESVGTSPDGAMDVPQNLDDVAWFNLGPRPGAVGSAVIDGHSGWSHGIPAVFDNLYTIQKGDTILVQDQNGITTTFVVRDVKTYDPKANASAVFTSSDGKTHLNLITCTGPWSAIQKTHVSRLVVFSDMEK